MAKEQFDPKEFQKSTQEALSVIQDTLVSFAADLAVSMKNAIRDTGNEADRLVKKSVGTNLSNAFKDVEKAVKEAASANDQFTKGLLKASDIKRKRLKLEDKLAKLDRERNEAAKYGIELLEEQDEHYLDIKEQVEKIYKVQEDEAKKLERRLGGLVGLMGRLSKVPILGQLLEAEEAAEAMRTTLMEGGSELKALFKGISASIQNIKGAAVAAAAGKTAQTVGGFIFDLFLGAEQAAVDLAQALGTSVELGNDFMDLFKGKGLEGYYKFDTVLKAAQAFRGEFGVIGSFTRSALDTMLLLNERLELAATDSAKIAMLFGSFGKNSYQSLTSVNKLVKSLAKSNKFAVPLDIVLKDIATAGEETAGYYAFSADALAEAAIKTRQFGLALSQTKSIASGLLDFEKSISDELQLRLVTGANINLNAARTAAFFGDQAEATRLVLEEMKKIPVKMRTLPIVMQTMSDAANMTADELNRALMVSEKTSSVIDDQTKLEQASIDQIKERKDAVSEVAETLQGLKDDLKTLFNTENLQKFITNLQGLTTQISLLIDRIDNSSLGDVLLGTEGIKRATNIALEARTAYSNLMRKDFASDEDYEKAQQEAKRINNQAVDNALRKIDEKIDDTFNPGTLYNLRQQKKSISELRLNDFTIRANPKDTLVMAGGTRFGNETNKLLEELIVAVKQGGHVYIDGRKVGETLATNYTAFS